MLEKEVAKFDGEEAKKVQLFQGNPVEPAPKWKSAAHPTIIQLASQRFRH
ncbi:MAG: hypothetical protein ABR955_06895 [Verrucomicrobiota bacterium]